MKIIRTIVYEGSDERVTQTVSSSLENGEHDFGDLKITVTTVEGPSIATCRPNGPRGLSHDKKV